MVTCPICRAETTQKRPGTPYFICGNCDCWFQSPFPPKTFIADFEGDPTVMSEGDKGVNRALADRLFKTVMGSKAGRTLDIGAKLPVFAAALATNGCQAWAVEHEPIKHDLYEVTEIRTDFESDEWIESWPQKFDFISLIHAVEHFNRPWAVVEKLRKLIDDDGAVFIRMPDHEVKGYERDLTDGHYKIHPYYHTLSSILQVLYETAPTFQVVDTWAMDGYGQRDIVLRPIVRARKIALGIIAKNEEKDLPHLFDSVRTAVDMLCLIDTGSTDKTMEVATLSGIAPYTVKRYTGASRKDSTGDWKLEDFSKARNVYLGEALRSGADWVLNLDADDVLLTPDAIRRASYWTQHAAYAMWIKDGGNRWVTHRLWKTNVGIKYDGRCHEYPSLGNLPSAMLDDCLIEHHGTPAANQENSNARNLRILELEWADRQSPRCAFYLANTHRDGGRWKEAAAWYAKRIAMGEGYRDEWLFAHLYAARALRQLNQIQLARDALADALKTAPDWCEFTMELAQIAYSAKDYPETIRLCESCLDAPIPPTQLWREPSAYRDQPARLISWCHEHMGNIGQALAWSEIAAEKIGGPDQEWEDRHKRLRSAMMQPPLIKPALPPMIALHRPGAIGDILMTLNLIPLLKAKYPDHLIHYYCAAQYVPENQLGGIILAAGCDSVYDCSLFAAKQGQYKHAINLIGYPLAEGYPEKPMGEHLLDYFSREMGLDPPSWTASELPALSLPKPPLPMMHNGERYCTVQQHAGWSKYKELAPDKWQRIIEALVYAETIPVVQIDEKYGLSLADSISLIANASMHIGVDSFGNHLTHYLWDGKRVPGIILWGSTQWDAAGYPTNVNISKGLPCQPCFRETHPGSLHPREPCINIAPSGVHSCMDQIEPAEVIRAARKLWAETK